MASAQFTGGTAQYVDPAQYAALVATLPAFDKDAQDEYTDAFDALFTLNDVGPLGAFSHSLSQENQQNIYSLNCANAKYMATADQSAGFSGILLSNTGWDTIAALTGAGRQTTVSASTPVVGEAHGTGRTIGTPIRVNHKSADGALVTAIVVKQGATTLTVNTDYRVFLGDGTNGLKGWTYITPITAQTNPITFGYSYVTATAEYTGLETKPTVIPQTAYIFISCPYQIADEDTVNPWRRQMIYLTGASLTGDLTTKFFKQGDTYEGLTFEVKGDGGVFIIKEIRGASQAAVS